MAASSQVVDGVLDCYEEGLVRSFSFILDRVKPKDFRWKLVKFAPSGWTMSLTFWSAYFNLGLSSTWVIFIGMLLRYSITLFLLRTFFFSLCYTYRRNVNVKERLVLRYGLKYMTCCGRPRGYFLLGSVGSFGDCASKVNFLKQERSLPK